MEVVMKRSIIIGALVLAIAMTHLGVVSATDDPIEKNYIERINSLREDLKDKHAYLNDAQDGVGTYNVSHFKKKQINDAKNAMQQVNKDFQVLNTEIIHHYNGEVPDELQKAITLFKHEYLMAEIAGIS